MKKIVCAAALTAGFALAAPMAQAQSQNDWAGGYFGAFLGWGQLESEWSTGILTSGNFDVDGALGGLYGGYNWQSGNMVYGVEAELGTTDMDSTSFAAPCGGTGCRTEVNNYATLRGRLGTELGGGLLYGALGVAWGDFQMTGGGNSVSDDSTGWVAAVGYDLPLPNKWDLRTEISILDFDKLDFAPVPGLRVDADKFTSIKVGIAKRF